MFDKICSDCNKDVATKKWRGGQELCSKCFNKWREKERKVYEELRDEVKSKIKGGVLSSYE